MREQVVIGAGATRVILQVLHAVTSGREDGDDVADVDGYPILAQMARLIGAVALDAHGHPIDAMAMRRARAGGHGVPTAQPDRHR